ncbi:MULTISPECIES: hypothetical protein [unclassified Sphingobium]|uniref:hypothetical protein n=1 Tax=unclassified Sphingobium TaxID=2611147 RepID=UPI000D155E79|nr:MULTISPECIES: hypothetical protein [unclassified Sphingobium]MBG6116422.1 hypothetical protein [Sphingobium sp. JAI105]PSO09753.1 hypothetical protein C7E20_20855 [Sphingobium sp. AEW4]TWC97733.1 hypothetical protein FB595_1327 [Sphingobium sp. AEW010]TWD17828.1 hypothetical protein FB596_1339 [Sphingobium sp. AEW013]TWD20076.1 hypothetical protein FB594_1337 [Sphingobium sp. AEW001]
MIITALVASLAGILLCWRAWVRHALDWRAGVAAATLWSLSTWAWIAAFGAEIGIALALETAALLAFAFILTRIEVRPAQAIRDRTAPPLPPRSYGRGIARALTAGLLGFAAAIGLAMLFATRAPLAEQTRLILAALAMPSLWCGAIAWTACDRRLSLQIGVFLGLAVTSAGITFITA